MGIDTVGTSLLASAKKANKKKEKNAIMGAVGNLAGQFLKRGVESAFETNKKVFEQNEGILAKKLKYKATVARGADIISTQTKIAESGKDATQYFYDQYEKTFSDNLKNELGPEISGDERLFKMHTKQLLMPHAEEYATRHKEGLALAESLGTYDQYSTDLDAKIKKAHPDNLVDGIIGGAVRMLSGKSKAEQHAEVVASIQQGPMSKSAEAMVAFNERYKETKDALMSFNYATALAAEDIKRIAEEELDTVVSKTDTITPSDGRLFSTTETTTVTKRGLPDEQINITVSTPVEITSWSDDEDEIGKVKSMTASYNLATDAKAMMTPDAYSAYIKETNGAKLNVYNIRTVDDYGKMADILNKYTQNKDNLNDKFRDDVIVASMSTLNQGSIKLKELMVSLENVEENSDEYARLMAELTAEKEMWFGHATAIADYSTEITRARTTIPNSKGVNKKIWDSASVIQKQKMNQLSTQDLINSGFITQ
tara:strand:+ start:913 stop:2361 length:1449 start_codon:yes stop_codon:yes gene_type:complete